MKPPRPPRLPRPTLVLLALLAVSPAASDQSLAPAPALGGTADTLHARLDPDRRIFFNDNLRVYAHVMTHLSRALDEFLLAYRDQADRAAAVRHLTQAEREVEILQGFQRETQHGIFAHWYDHAEPMERTVQFDAWRTTLQRLRRQMAE